MYQLNGNVTIRHAEEFVKAYVNAGLLREGTFVKRYKPLSGPTRTELIGPSNNSTNPSCVYDSPKDLIARISFRCAGKMVYQLKNKSYINYKGR